MILMILADDSIDELPLVDGDVTLSCYLVYALLSLAMLMIVATKGFSNNQEK